MTCDSLLLPHLQIINEDLETNFSEEFTQASCHLRLSARLSSASSFEEKPTLFSDFLLQDYTKIILPSSDASNYYSFPCPLNDDKLFFHCFCIEPSQYARSTIPLDIPMENHLREYFVSEMSRFTHEVIEEARGKFHIRVYATASIARNLWYNEITGIEKKIKGLRSNKEENSSYTSDCAVCFDTVEMSRFQGVKLDCSHVFHLTCIAPWLVKSNTCPMCRCEQFADV